MSRQKGLSLIEMVVAVLILSVGALAAATMQLTRRRRTKQQTTARSLRTSPASCSRPRRRGATRTPISMPPVDSEPADRLERRHEPVERERHRHGHGPQLHPDVVDHDDRRRHPHGCELQDDHGPGHLGMRRGRARGRALDDQGMGRMSRRNQAGATVIEHLIVIVIMTIVLAASTSLFAFGTRTFSRETVTVTLQEDMVGAKNIILDELSIAGFRPTELVANGPFPPIGATTILSSADVIDVVNPGGSSSLTTFDDLDFRADVDSDQDTDRICYRLVSGQLRRRVIEDPAADCSSGRKSSCSRTSPGSPCRSSTLRGTC